MEADIRRFLLGDMSEAERSAFEEMFVADEDVFEQVRVGEDELVESYIRGTLTSIEKEKFERSFLTTERRRSRVEFTRTMLDKLAVRTKADVKKTDAPANASFWSSIADFFKTPAFAYGAAFALLVLIFGAWFVRRNAEQTEIARHPDPAPTVQTIQTGANENLPADGNVPVKSNANAPEKIPANKNASPNANAKAPDGNQNSGTHKQPANRSSPTLALFTGAVRAEGKTSELNLPQDAPGANLQLNLDTQDYKLYRVEIVNPDGVRVFQTGNLKVKNSKINFFVPAHKLARGDYLIKLSALNPQNESESVADYALRVNRK